MVVLCVVNLYVIVSVILAYYILVWQAEWDHTKNTIAGRLPNNNSKAVLAQLKKQDNIGVTSKFNNFSKPALAVPPHEAVNGDGKRKKMSYQGQPYPVILSHVKLPAFTLGSLHSQPHQGTGKSSEMGSMMGETGLQKNSVCGPHVRTTALPNSWTEEKLKKKACLITFY